MNYQKSIEEVEQAYSEIVELINKSSERGQFVSGYFRKPFFEWFAKKMSQNEKE